ncbi:hypothetical protein L6Q21_14820 [Sandaracinobacter sp. RS1-74]|uniref:hypothetical protein n=1 Tax=Sandaracinobacteroides sayramensis TaxID=2913411 RepID=UPI001EDA4D04|nr:hypothetical protein [Sandaracinobacteroides sayramensis]MCG2842248.1 hypothetical protein [Sandaracinobacteroides sayramensis]
MTEMVAGGRSNLRLRHKQAKMIAGSNPGPALAWNGDLPAKVMEIIRSLNDTLPHAQLIRAAA